MTRTAEVAARTEFEGKCEVCGDTKLRTHFTRHLSACLRKDAGGGTRPAGTVVPASLLVVEGVGFATYWLQLAARDDATLRDLDRYLRAVWLECCRHMSAFRTPDGRYFYSGHRDSSWRPSDSGMDVPIGEVLPKGATLEHDYDFGSTTTLRICAVGERTVRFAAKANVRLLARNFAPSVTCAACDEKAATVVCGGCWGSMDALVCAKCSPDHECGEEMLLPIVNSPRTGVCGYTGAERR